MLCDSQHYTVNFACQHWSMLIWMLLNKTSSMSMCELTIWRVFLESDCGAFPCLDKTPQTSGTCRPRIFSTIRYVQVFTSMTIIISKALLIPYAADRSPEYSNMLGHHCQMIFMAVGVYKSGSLLISMWNLSYLILLFWNEFHIIILIVILIPTN